MGTIQRTTHREQRVGAGYVELGTVNVPIIYTRSGVQVSPVDTNSEMWSLPIARYYERGEESRAKLATLNGDVQLVLHAEEPGEVDGRMNPVVATLYVGDTWNTVTMSTDDPDAAKKLVGLIMRDVVMSYRTRLTDDLTLFLEVLQDYMQELLDYAVEPVR